MIVEVELINVIKSLLVLVNTSEYEHRCLSGAGRVPVSSFDTSFHSSEFKPDVFLQVISIEVVQSLCAIPASEDIHQTLMDDSCMPKSYIGLRHEGNVVEHRSWALFLVRVHDPVHLVAVSVRVVEDLAPLVRQDRVFMDVLEDLDLVSPAVDVESVFVPNEGVIGPSLWNLIYRT